MPIFEFQCPDCGHVFEDIQLTGHDQPACPACKAPNTQRLMSASSALTGKNPASFPDAKGHGCCGENPHSRGCVPGTCCGRAKG